MMLLLRRTLQL